MAEITKPIMLDETGQELIDKINELKNVLAPTGTLTIDESGTYDVSEKATVIANFAQDGVITPVYIPTITMQEVVG